MHNYEEEKLAITNAFMYTLQISGMSRYNEGFRKQVPLLAYRGVANITCK